jgi:hypothetical protein
MLTQYATLSGKATSSSADCQGGCCQADATAWMVQNGHWVFNNILCCCCVPSCRLLASSCTDVQEHAAAALMNMARDIIYGIPVAIAAAGGIPALVR